MRRQVVLAAGLLGVLALGACSHGSSGSAGGNDSVNGGVAHGDSAAGAPVAAGAVSKPNTAGSAAAGGSARGSLPRGSAADSVRLGGSYEIRTAQLTVAVRGARNVAAKADAAETIVLGVGGEVDSDDRTSGPQASASLLLRVPPDALPDTLTKLSGLGAEKSRQTSTTDVTQKVADVHSRVESAQRAIEGFRRLVNRAQKVSEIITLESELNAREADLESLEAQYLALSNQTSMAAITLQLVTAPKHHAPPPPPAKHHHRGGFLGGLDRGWDAFTAATGWLAVAVGTLLPFLVLLLVVGLAARALWPRLPRRRTPVPTPSE
jgi:hypothetical protein